MSDATPSPSLSQLRIVTKKDLRKVVPYCDQHIRRLEKAGKFPRRIDLGENRVGWFEVDIIAWIKSRPVRDYPASDDDST